MKFTEQLSLSFSNFSVIFGKFFKFQHFESRVEESICILTPVIFHPDPYKEFDLHNYTLSGAGESPLMRWLPEVVGMLARVNKVLTLS